MSGDGTTDRGAKPPRTLFSLGRPGPKSTAADAGAGDPTAADAVDQATTDVASDVDGGIELACGACGTTLVAGAAFCGECGTPVAQLDDGSSDLVDEVPMADLEDAHFGEYVEELAIDDAPAVLYADADPAAGTLEPTLGYPDPDHPDADGTSVVAPPAAVLYADPSQAEPLPPTPSGSFAIVEPTFGTSDTDLDPASAPVDADEPTTVDAGAAPSAEPGAAGAGADDETEEHSAVAPLAVAGGAIAAGAVLAGADGAGAATDAAGSPADGPGPVTAADAPGADPSGSEPAGTELADAETAGADPTTVSGPADAPAADAPVMPWADAPTTVSPAAVPIAGAAVAGSGAVTPPTPVSPAAYGETPPPAAKSKTGLLVGIAAAVVLVLIVGGVLIATGGSKDEGVQTAQQPTTTVGPTTTTTATSSTDAPTTSSGPPTSAPTSTAPPASETTAPTTAAPVTTAGPTVPTTPRPPVTTAPTTIPPGRIVADRPAGSVVSIPKGGSTTLTLTNVGGTQAGCALTGSGGVSVTQNCSPSLAPGFAVTVIISAAPTFEGPAVVTGVLEGTGSYSLTVNVGNG